jgi:hypothetical protein
MATLGNSPGSRSTDLRLADEAAAFRERLYAMERELSCEWLLVISRALSGADTEHVNRKL